jgi:hypothetical protein
VSTRHYEWRGSVDPADESGYATFYAGGAQSDSLLLPHFRYVTEIQRIIDAARQAGRVQALEEIKHAVKVAMETCR